MIRHLLRSTQPRNGFSIVELLVVTACLGLLLGASISVTQNALRREEGVTVVLSVAGWLEEIQRNALRLNLEEGCTVTFEASQGSWTPRNPGERIASVTPPACAIESELLLPRTGFTQGSSTADRKPFAITIAHGSGSWNGPQLVFTRRGSVPLTNHYRFAVKSLITNNKTTNRCVRITAVVGSIGVGRLPEADNSPLCQTETYDDEI
jgi:type II secretory pathway pseudopilin PulG